MAMTPLSPDLLKLIGHAVLRYAVVEPLFRLFPGHSEYELSTLASGVLNKKYLAVVADILGLAVRAPADGPDLEEVVGQLHQEHGLDAVMSFVSDIIFPTEEVEQEWPPFLPSKHRSMLRLLTEHKAVLGDLHHNPYLRGLWLKPHKSLNNLPCDSRTDLRAKWGERVRDLEALEESMGLRFENLMLCHLSLTHPSHSVPGHSVSNNASLEFFGDSVLGYLCALFIARAVTEASRVVSITILRSIHTYATQNTTLSHVSRQLNLHKYFLHRMSDGDSSRQYESALADCFESFLGAIALDMGLVAAQTFLSVVLFPLIAEHLEVCFTNMLPFLIVLSHWRANISSCFLTPPFLSLLMQHDPEMAPWVRQRERLNTALRRSDLGDAQVERVLHPVTGPPHMRLHKVVCCSL